MPLFAIIKKQTVKYFTFRLFFNYYLFRLIDLEAVTTASSAVAATSSAATAASVAA